MRRCCAIGLVVAAVVGLGPVPSTAGPASRVVVALIDTGINPYAPAFRDDSALAQKHPSTYLPGYPADAKALRLSLGARSLSQALKADADVWESVRSRTLYWIPGTKIVGVISMGSGGRSCARDVSGTPVTFPPPAGTLNVGPQCPERLILDDAGHGTSTASRVAGTPHSLAPEARLVMIEGLGDASSRWAADAGWIDVQSNSWGYLTGHFPGAGRTFTDLASRQVVVTASGNGLGFSGFGPEPTYLHGLAAPGVIVAGGHDNGHVTAWSGAPSQVVADAFAPYTAMWNSMAQMRPDPVACCTSTASPYVAGGAAALILKARTLLGHVGTGVKNGILASGPAGRVTSGPLADGRFTLEELRAVLFATAEARPREGRDDGAMHFTGGPAQPQWLEGNGSGENPYCQGCWTLPAAWADVPAQVPAYLDIGYGAINERSIALGHRVLRGKAALPPRPDEDAFFAVDTTVREALHPNL